MYIYKIYVEHAIKTCRIDRCTYAETENIVKNRRIIGVNYIYT